MNDETNHPWQSFLDARVKVIDWMVKKFNKNDKQIAESLSMDETQVYLIRTYYERSE